ncbi:MAG TPA: hypothetical protein VGN57_11525 [Pirellulaceae bacterium]|jgi:hypothetical protein|nr:hypothetical protein [Pirellulaceae bacterium]
MKSRFAAALAGSILFAAAALVGCESSTMSPEAAAMLLSERPAETMSVAEVREKVEAGDAVDEVAVEAQIGGAPVPFIPEHAGFFVTAAAPSHDHDHEGHDHAGHDHEGHDHGDHDHADHDHGDAEEHAHADDHAGHDHGDEGHVHSHDHAGHDHAGHDPSTCPFCKQGVEGKKNLAMVKLMDGKGEVLGTSADKLLRLKEKQQVVVVGKPSLDADGNLYIEATKIYVAK